MASSSALTDASIANDQQCVIGTSSNNSSSKRSSLRPSKKSDKFNEFMKSLKSDKNQKQPRILDETAVTGNEPQSLRRIRKRRNTKKIAVAKFVSYQTALSKKIFNAKNVRTLLEKNKKKRINKYVKTTKLLKHKQNTSNTPANLLRPSRKNKIRLVPDKVPIKKDKAHWRPADDLSLVINIQQTKDLNTVHRCVKFSCMFTKIEIQDRWKLLLYNQLTSKKAAAAIRNLHPKIVAHIHAQALYSTEEEQILGTIKSTENPSLDTFEYLLNANIHVFYHSRTPKALMSYWKQLRSYKLLPGQIEIEPAVHPLIKEFDQLVEYLDDRRYVRQTENVLSTHDSWMDSEMIQEDRKNKRQIRQIENELKTWKLLFNESWGYILPEFNNDTFAILHGYSLKFLIKCPMVTIGRGTRDNEVDIDLTLEQGTSNKISRRQGTIIVKRNGIFTLISEGKRTMYVDGRPVLRGGSRNLTDKCLLKIADIKLIFFINTNLIRLIQQTSVFNH